MSALGGCKLNFRGLLTGTLFEPLGGRGRGTWHTLRPYSPPKGTVPISSKLANLTVYVMQYNKRIKFVKCYFKKGTNIRHNN